MGISRHGKKELLKKSHPKPIAGKRLENEIINPATTAQAIAVNVKGYAGHKNQIGWRGRWSRWRLHHSKGATGHLRKVFANHEIHVTPGDPGKGIGFIGRETIQNPIRFSAQGDKGIDDGSGLERGKFFQMTPDGGASFEDLLLCVFGLEFPNLIAQ